MDVVAVSVRGNGCDLNFLAITCIDASTGLALSVATLLYRYSSSPPGIVITGSDVNPQIAVFVPPHKVYSSR